MTAAQERCISMPDAAISEQSICLFNHRWCFDCFALQKLETFATLVTVSFILLYGRQISIRSL